MSRRNRKAEARASGRGNQLRIIGGSHRGRRLSFPDQPGLRPTSDRVRETLFNWLQPQLPGADCLDPFAGSGALGLEAASRGAGRVVMLERAARAVDRIRANIGLLELGQTSIECVDALQWLQREGAPFDIVFLDPPFADDLLAQCCHLLEDRHWLKPGARIYLEMDAAQPLFELPPAWQLLKQKKAGQVSYRLYSSG